MQIYTTTMQSGSITLNREDGASVISVQPAENSAVIITGDFSFQGTASQPMTRSDLQIFNFQAASPASPLQGITITWVSGNVDIVIGF